MDEYEIKHLSFDIRSLLEFIDKYYQYKANIDEATFNLHQSLIANDIILSEDASDLNFSKIKACVNAGANLNKLLFNGDSVLHMPNNRLKIDLIYYLVLKGARPNAEAFEPLLEFQKYADTAKAFFPILDIYHNANIKIDEKLLQEFLKTINRTARSEEERKEQLEHYRLLLNPIPTAPPAPDPFTYQFNTQGSAPKPDKPSEKREGSNPPKDNAQLKRNNNSNRKGCVIL